MASSFISHAQDFEAGSTLVQRGFDYWKIKAGTRPAPTWRDIDPAEIKDLLPNILCIHVRWNPLDFVERITGQKVLENNHRNSMGVSWRDYPGRGPDSQIWGVIAEVATKMEPSFQDVPYVGPYKDFMRVQTVSCPISDDGITVNKVLGFVDFLRRSPPGVSLSS